MSTEPAFDEFSRLNEVIEHSLHAARVPGAAVAIVRENRTALARGYGFRDLARHLPVTGDTRYPIASITKAMTATLLGQLMDEGKLAWDRPVQHYLPHFRLGDASASAQITIRDLLTMRTGLPRHDWLWQGHDLMHAELIERLPQLPLSAGFREKFQYSNLTYAVAGYIAEVVTGVPWDKLIRTRILKPLGMSQTDFGEASTENLTLPYHENSAREIVRSEPLSAQSIGPAGGTIHSTVKDMARWVAFNLTGGQVNDQALIQRETLSEIQSPQIPVRGDASCPSPNACYGFGWFIDTYRGHTRIAHSGYLHNINGEMALFPQLQLGVVCFTNFGFVRLARFLNQQIVDVLLGLECEPVESKLAQYEGDICRNRARLKAVPQVQLTRPSHDLIHYTGCFEHLAYGIFEVALDRHTLVLRRGRLKLPLQHRHYDSWFCQDIGIFPLHEPHAFDRSSPVTFEMDTTGSIAAFTLQLEQSVPPLRFKKRSALLKAAAYH